MIHIERIKKIVDAIISANAHVLLVDEALRFKGVLSLLKDIKISFLNLDVLLDTFNFEFLRLIFKEEEKHHV